MRASQVLALAGELDAWGPFAVTRGLELAEFVIAATAATSSATAEDELVS